MYSPSTQDKETNHVSIDDFDIDSYIQDKINKKREHDQEMKTYNKLSALIAAFFLILMLVMYYTAEYIIRILEF